MAGPSVMHLLQLADANFPSGGFAFSNGLESLAKLGHLKDIEGFKQYLACYLEQIASAELPFLNSAFAAAPSVPPPAADRAVPAPPAALGAAFSDVLREWDAWIFLPAPRRASLSQGQAWCRAMEAAQGEATVAAVRPAFASAGLPLHFLMAFAATLKAAGFGRDDARLLLMHLSLRDQLGAAVRLGLVGSLQAQRLHREHAAIGEGLAEARADWTCAEAVRGAPMLDMGQASHPRLYSKLFQS